MDPPIVDCRSLIEFCRAFEKHRSSTPLPSRNPRRPKSSLNPLSHPFCSDHSPFAAIDAAVLLLVAASLSFLTFPYLSKALLLLRLLSLLLHHAPFFYASALLLSSLLALFLYELLSHYSRKCGSPFCKGLKKAVEFDIQLESEECVKYLPPVPQVLGVRPLELGEDHKELEAELKKMAPPNGRTVLIFRAPCGCPAGRMEVWGPKKVRRIKK